MIHLRTPKPPANDKLARITRTVVAVVLLAHCAITAHFYYSWPFDGEEGEEGAEGEVCEGRPHSVLAYLQEI